MSTQTTVLPPTPADGDRVNVRVELPFLESMVLSNTSPTLRCSVPALERVVGGAYARVVSAPVGPAVATVSLAGDTLMCDLNLSQPSDREHGSGQVRRLLDLDADPLVVADVLSRNEALSGLVAARPGLPSPGAVDGFELAVRTVMGQQISVASATNGLQRILVQNDLPTIPGTDLFEFPGGRPAGASRSGGHAAP